MDASTGDELDVAACEMIVSIAEVEHAPGDQRRVGWKERTEKETEKETETAGRMERVETNGIYCVSGEENYFTLPTNDSPGLDCLSCWPYLT